MGYVESGFHKKGTELLVEVRGKARNAKITGMPFVRTNYYKNSDDGSGALDALTLAILDF